MTHASLILMAFVIKLADLLVTLIGLFVVPFGIRYGFNGILWWWGNDDHADAGGEFWRTQCGGTWWCKYQWFALRNASFNWAKYGPLGVKLRPYTHKGDADIGDAKKGGSYWCRMTGTPFFEYYLIIPYGKRCVRVRIGWKMYGGASGSACQFCFVVNPFKAYSGV